jgi:hypothetical protein
MMKQLTTTLLLILIMMPLALAQEDGEILVGSFELEKIINVGSAALAAALAIVTLVAYQRTKNKRLLYVTAAFVLFSIKGLLLSLELFSGEWPIADVIASALDFVILVTFFIGILKK